MLSWDSPEQKELLSRVKDLAVEGFKETHESTMCLLLSDRWVPGLSVFIKIQEKLKSKLEHFQWTFVRQLCEPTLLSAFSFSVLLG